MELLDIRHNILFFQILGVLRYMYLVSNSVLLASFLLSVLSDRLPTRPATLSRQHPYWFILMSNDIPHCRSASLLFIATSARVYHFNMSVLLLMYAFGDVEVHFAHSSPLGLYTSLLPSPHFRISAYSPHLMYFLYNLHTSHVLRIQAFSRNSRILGI